MKRRKNAGKGFGMMFHGAFGDKKAAKKKERQVHGFIQPRNIKGKRRFVVMSERKNPIKRKRKVDLKKLSTRAKLESLAQGLSAATGKTFDETLAYVKAGEKKRQRQAKAFARSKSNPAELIVLGANPSGPPQQPQEFVVPAGSTITIRTNPSAAAIREEFVGAPAEWETVENEPHMPAGDYAQLGELLALYVKPSRGHQVQQISFNPGRRPMLVSDESAKQLYFVGGDQDISRSLCAFGAEDTGGGHFKLGDARRIDYKQRKEHVPQPGVDEWRHDFGEESGVLPVLWFDANAKRLLLKGGEYEIKREGIIN